MISSKVRILSLLCLPLVFGTQTSLVFYQNDAPIDYAEEKLLKTINGTHLMTKCGSHCAADARCVFFILGENLCSLYYSYFVEGFKKATTADPLFTVTGTYEDEDLTLLSATYFTPAGVYMIAHRHQQNDQYGKEVTISFFKDANFHRPESHIASYPFLDLFPRPADTRIEWTTMTQTCLHEETNSDGKILLNVCRGGKDGACKHFVQTTPEDLSSWEEDDSIYVESQKFDKRKCYVRWRDVELDLDFDHEDGPVFSESTRAGIVEIKEGINAYYENDNRRFAVLIYEEKEINGETKYGYAALDRWYVLFWNAGQTVVNRKVPIYNHWKK